MPAPEEPSSLPASPPPVSPTPTPALSSQPSPTARLSTATPPPELAPPGVFYLLTSARMETAHGLQKLTPGTGVKLVRPGIYLTPLGEMPLLPEQLTNDLSQARRARDADRTSQAAIQRQATPAVNPARAAENDAAHQAALRDIARQHLNTRISGLQQREKQLASVAESLRQKQAKEQFDKIYKGRTVTSTTTLEQKNNSAQIDAVRQQIASAQQELAELK